MKNFSKYILFLIFAGLNIGAALLIARYFQISWGIIAVIMVIVLALIDLPQRIQNYKIKQKQKELQEQRQKENKQNRQIANMKKQEAVKRQRRLNERDLNRRGGR